MRLEGIHHITAITGDAQGNVDYYVDTLGLRLVKKTVNQDDPTIYHLFYADEHGSAGADITFFEYPGARRGRAGAGHSEEFLRALGFQEGWVARGEQRSGLYVYDDAPAEPGVPGGGTIHHVAWGSKPEEHEAWRARAMEAGARPTPVIERFYFKSIYFREPSGVLFEIATLGPGFTADEPLESLGERLSLPPDFEPLRNEVEPKLTPLRNPREAWTRS